MFSGIIAQEYRVKKYFQNLEIKWELSGEDNDELPPIVPPTVPYGDMSQTEGSDKDIEEESTSPGSQLKVLPGTSTTYDVTKFRSLEEELRVANRVASGFVAMVLAGAVAEHITAQLEDNHTLEKKPSVAQVQYMLR